MSEKETTGRMRLCAALFAAASLLAACGGGGGGGSGDGAGSPAPAPTPAPTPSGLVPTAPTPGAVLEADATSLRVLRPGATWTYHGSDLPGGTGVATVYANVVTQVASGSGVTETSTNLFAAGADVSTEQVVGADVDSPQSLQPSPAVAAETITGLELRSPVRAGDQYTVYDRHFADSGVDLDGDGKHDALDAAVWSQVVGAETIDLPNRRGVATIRVDTTVAQRVAYSKTGTLSAVVQTIRHVWYAKGIGIVKQQVDEPADNDPSLRHLATETLDTWDGLTAGVGALPVQRAIVPSGASAGQTLPYPIDTAAFDDHAVVMSLIPGTFAAAGVNFTSVDLTGKVTGSVNQAGAAIGESFFEGQRVFRMGSELRVVASGTSSAAFLVGYDAQGQAMTLPPVDLLANAVVHADGDGNGIQAAVGGGRLWLLWLNASAADTNLFDLMLRSFDASGVPASAPLTLVAGISPNAVHALRLSAAADRTIATWGVGGFVQAQHYAVVDTAGGTLLAVKDVTPAAAVTADPFSGAYLALRPLALGGTLAFTFDDDRVSGQLDGVALDASFDIIRSSTGALGSEAISPSWLTPETAPLTQAGLGHVFFGVTGQVTIWPEDSLPTSVASIAELTPGGGALATTSRTALLGRIAGLSPIVMLPYADRVLVVGTQANALAVTAVWRLP